MARHTTPATKDAIFIQINVDTDIYNTLTNFTSASRLQSGAPRRTYVRLKHFSSIRIARRHGMTCWTDATRHARRGRREKCEKKKEERKKVTRETPAPFVPLGWRQRIVEIVEVRSTVMQSAACRTFPLPRTLVGGSLVLTQIPRGSRHCRVCCHFPTLLCACPIMPVLSSWPMIYFNSITAFISTLNCWFVVSYFPFPVPRSFPRFLVILPVLSACGSTCIYIVHQSRLPQDPMRASAEQQTRRTLPNSHAAIRAAGRATDKALHQTQP